MPTATIGSPQTIALGAADALIVSCSAVDAVASVAGSTGFIGAPYELGRVVGETGKRFGPYGRSVSLIVTALAGSITAEVSQPSRVGDGADALSAQQGAASQSLVSQAGNTSVVRNSGLTVVAMKYNHWFMPGAHVALGSGSSVVADEGSTAESWDAWPWKSLDGYPERQPIWARKFRARPFWNWSDAQTSNQLLNGWNVAASVATLTRADATGLRITPVLADNYVYSPDYLNLPGDGYLTVIVKCTRLGGSGWDGKLYFTTDEDQVLNGTKSFTITQPGSWSGEQTLTITTSGNATWMAGIIRKIRLDLGNTTSDVFDIRSVEIVATPAQRRREYVVAAPVDQQWVVDKELAEAYDHGVDVFSVCHYQESLSGAGKHDFYFTRVAASTVTQPIKICIIGVYQPPYNALFTSTANIQAVAAKYSAIITALGDRYWKLNGRPVIQMFAESSVASQMITSGVPSAYTGGETVPNIKTALAHFIATIRAKVLADTGMNPWIVDQHNGSYPTWFAEAGPGTANPNPVNGAYVSVIKAAGFDACTSYIHRSAHADHSVTGGTGGGSALNWPYAPGDSSLLADQLVRSYSTLVECRDRNVEWILNGSGFTLPYYPNVTVGWARYPWSDRDAVQANPEDQCWPSFAGLKANFARARAFVDRFPAQTQGIVTIYAWDEFGEGGVLCPTKGNGYMALQAMREGLGL